MESKVWILNDPPEKEVQKDTFALKTRTLPELQNGQVLLKVIFLSNDPAQRGWIDKNIDPARLYVPPVKKGDVMRAGSVARVEKSRSPNVKEGDLVSATCGWAEYSVMDASQVKAIQPIPGVSPSVFVGALGGPGLTAYFGLTDVLQFKSGQSIVISGAAGAVGNIVTQYARYLGASKIICIAGSDDKCPWLKKLGADEAINYKQSDFEQKLLSATEGEVDCYFDNVGGPILDLMLTRVKKHGVIACCGAISSYNDLKNTQLTNWFQVIANRLNLKGFIVLDYLHKAPEAFGALSKAIEEGHLTLEDAETVVECSFEKIPDTWQRLFSGANQGKLVTQISKL